MSDETMPLSEFVKLVLSLMVAFVIAGMLISIYLWWVSPQIKADANAKNVLEELDALVAAQGGGDWSVETFIALDRNYQLIIFGNNSIRFAHERYPNKIYEKGSCKGPCACLFKESDSEAPEIIACTQFDGTLRETVAITPFLSDDTTPQGGVISQHSCNVYQISYVNKVLDFTLDPVCEQVNQERDVLDNQQMPGARESPI